MSIRNAVVGYLSRFDKGIAPTASDVVNHVLSIQPRAKAMRVRRTLLALDDEGIVSSRWDTDARIYWIET